ncbi:hypothetical protein Hanom_Chr15g01374661 [Helianthus anomalus]
MRGIDWKLVVMVVVVVPEIMITVTHSVYLHCMIVESNWQSVHRVGFINYFYFYYIVKEHIELKVVLLLVNRAGFSGEA